VFERLEQGAQDRLVKALPAEFEHQVAIDVDK
jgi:hypothetical protein